MKAMLVLACVALAACSGGTRRSDAVDVNAAAARAEGDIANYAEGMPARPEARSSPVPTTAPAVAPRNDDVDVSPAGAAEIVRRYYALIGRGDYRAAWDLWGEHGKASGMTAEAFAESFAKFARYHADIGAPGDVDAGAGQRNVTVPVRVSGNLRDGDQPFLMIGQVMLHRVAEGIDTPDPVDHAWRIGSADVKPRPAETKPETGAPAE